MQNRTDTPRTFLPGPRRPQGTTLPYPAGYEPHEQAKADQRHTLTRQATNQLVDAVTQDLATGYDPRDPGVHIRITIDRAWPAIARVAGQDNCGHEGCEHELPAAMMLIGELALRLAGRTTSREGAA